MAANDSVSAYQRYFNSNARADSEPFGDMRAARHENAFMNAVRSLTKAIESGDYPAVKEFLDNGFKMKSPGTDLFQNPRFEGPWYYNALEMAIKHGQLEIAKLLMDSGMDPFEKRTVSYHTQLGSRKEERGPLIGVGEHLISFVQTYLAEKVVTAPRKSSDMSGGRG